MAVRPTIGTDNIDKYRGSGFLGKTTDYLKVDPTTYFYEKFKSSNNEFLRDDYWSQAAQNGESDALIYYLSKWNEYETPMSQQDYEASNTEDGVDYQTYLDNLNSKKDENRAYYDKLKAYEGQGKGDYDMYMLTLSLPTLDDTEKIERIDTETGYNFGQYTNREWAKAILDSTFGRYDAELIEAEKENMNWWEKTWSTIGSLGASFVGGVVSFASDIYNIGEGIVNIFANFSDDASVGDRFLYAFSNDDWVKSGADLFNDAAYKLAVENTDMVNAVDAYEAGYRSVEWKDMWNGARSTGVGANYKTWGKYLTSMVNSVGYMLPSILLTQGIGAAGGTAAKVAGKIGTSVFYTGMASGNVSDTIERAQLKGLSYKDLNTGEVLSNAAFKAAAQWGVEILLGKILGIFSKSDQLIGIGSKGANASMRGITSTGSGALATALGRGLRSMGKEGLEEVLQNTSDSIVDWFYSMAGTDLYSVYESRIGDTLSFESMLEAFVVGALTEGVISGIGTIKYLPTSNRALATDAEGNVTPMGFAQTLNYNEALRTMNDWNNILNDKSASAEAKVDAATRMSMAINTVGSVIKSFGTEKALVLNNMLQSYAKNTEKNRLLNRTKAVEYATKLYNDFAEHYNTVVKKYVPKTIGNKIKNAIEKISDKLKKQQVTKIDNVITSKIDTSDPDGPINKASGDVFKSKLQELGVEAIVGVDGSIVTKSDEILFVNNKILENGDLAEVVKGIAYEQVQDTVKSKLSPAQKRMITKLYQKATGTDGSLDEAVMALLFDKNFYTKVLLLSEERIYGIEALKLLSTIDKIANSKASDAYKNGTLTDRAYKTLMNKIYETMRTGLITYCTQYVRIDIGNISNEILSPELKQVIQNHRNVIFSKFVDDGLSDKSKKVPDSDRVQRFDNYVNKFNEYLTSEQANSLKQKARSTSINDRVDAYTLLTQLSIANKNNQRNDKLVYLPKSNDGVLEQQYIKTVEDYFGVSWQELIEGTYDPNDLSEEAKNFILQQYDMSDYRSRMACIRDILFNASNKTLTIGTDGTVLRVLERDDVLISRYAGENGTKNLRADLRARKINTVGEMLKVDLPANIKNMRIVVSDTLNGAKGAYVDGTDYISLAVTADVNTVLHELTHATQFQMAIGKDDILGGTVGAFKNLPQNVVTSLDDYLAENFPLTYDYFTNHKITAPQIVYFMLAGELQANATMSTHMFDVGFTFRKNRSILVSPDGKTSWSMKASKSKTIQTVRDTMNKARKRQQNENVVLAEQETTTREVQVTSEQANIIQNMANSVSEETRQQAIQSVNNETFYRGKSGSGQKLRGVMNGRWYTDNIGVSETYYNSRIPGSSLNQARLSISNPLVIDAQGKMFSQLGPNMISDHIAIYARNNGYDSAIILNVVDVGPNLPSRENRIKATQPSTDVVIFNNDNIVSREVISSTSESRDLDSKKSATEKETVKRLKRQKAKEQEYHRLRYIPNKVAKESNLKYFIRTGIPIRMDPGLANFITSTTKDFDRLPDIIKSKIKNGTLTKLDIYDYIGSTVNLNEFAFKTIAKYVFNNDALANITPNEMYDLQDQISQLAVLQVPYLAEAIPNLDTSSQMTPKQMLAKLKEVTNKSKTDDTLSERFNRALRVTTTYRVFNDKGEKERREAIADPKTLNLTFFLHYDGTLDSIALINNIGKKVAYKQQVLSLNEDVETGKISASSEGDWNWNNVRKATEDESVYRVEDLVGLDTIDKIDKLNFIETYIRDVVGKRLLNEYGEAIKYNPEVLHEALAEIDSQIDNLSKLSDDELNLKYIEALDNTGNKKHPLGNLAKEPTVNAPESTSESEHDATLRMKKNVRNTAKTLLRYIAGLKSRYNSLSNDLKQYIVPTNKKNPDNKYMLSLPTDITSEQLSNLNKQIIEASRKLRDRINIADKAKLTKEISDTRLENMTPRGKETETKGLEKKTLRQKVQVEYKTVIKEQKFEFVTPVEANDTVKQLLNTNWDKTRMSTVQGLTNNREENIANGKKFFEQNATILATADLQNIEAATRWFLNTKMNNVTDSEYKKFAAVKMYFLGYVYGQTGPGKLYADMNANLKQQIENALKSEATVAGTMLSVWNNIQSVINPLSSMMSAEMEIDGVTLPEEQKSVLFDAINSNDINKIKAAQQELIQFVESQKTTKKSIFRKMVSIRSMSMLSSPLTWLRNAVSNFAVKRLNKLSSAIGNRVFKGKTQQGQLKLTGQVTPEIQKFITDNFIDNKFFDSFVSNLSKYNPSEISPRYKNADGTYTREAITAQLVIKSMYNEYYNKNMFKSKFMNSIHEKLMKVLSDDSYVREAAVRYFGKILAEKVYDLSDNVVTDAIMNDFSTAVGLAMNDYMHSDNFFNKFEKVLSDRSELGWFLYKTILPFGAASWNWFKAALKLSPFGLGRAIVNMTRLEQRVAKAESDFNAGKTNLSPQLVEYMTRRDFGAGVIGTIGWGLGMLLAALGYINLEDDDYGTPKLRIGRLTIDVSSIFGSSSILAGAALVTGLKDEGMTWQGLLKGLDRFADYTLSSFPLMEIVEMDMYTDGGFSMGLDQLESIALSYIPNFLNWVAGATYKGNVKKDTFLKRAIAKIPFLANILEKRIDPYTGSEGSWWDAFNRVVPYFSIDSASENERKTTALGLNKTELRGQYTINGEEFNITGKTLTTINKAYGQWNAEDLEEFYQNQMSVRLKVGNTYQTLTYNQMTDEQRKNAVQNIMSNNADLAKIYAWVLAGNRYYASASIYNQLIQKGITTNVYRGTRGFVSK